MLAQFHVTSKRTPPSLSWVARLEGKKYNADWHTDIRGLGTTLYLSVSGAGTFFCRTSASIEAGTVDPRALSLTVFLFAFQPYVPGEFHRL
jgi:hypothetical protein